jgi:hypothetical protein
VGMHWIGRGMPLLDVTNEMGSLDGTSTLVKLQTESEASRSLVKRTMVFGWKYYWVT